MRIAIFNREKFSRSLKLARASKKLSLKEAASQIGISFTLLGLYEKSNNNPSIISYQKCCLWLGVNMDFCFKSVKEEMYCIDDKYYNDLDEIIDEYSEDATPEEIRNLGDDFKLVVSICELRPFTIVKFEDFDIYRIIDESTLPEDDTDAFEVEMTKAFRDNINIDGINNALPKLWFPTKETITLTVEDFIKRLDT